MQNWLITRVSKQFRPRDVRDPAFFRELDELHIHASQELQARRLLIDIQPAQVVNTVGGGIGEVLSSITIKAGNFHYDPMSVLYATAMGAIANNAGAKHVQVNLNAIPLFTHTFQQNKANTWMYSLRIFNYEQFKQKILVTFAEQGEPAEVILVNTTVDLYRNDFTLSIICLANAAGDVTQELAYGELLRKEAGS